MKKLMISFLAVVLLLGLSTMAIADSAMEQVKSSGVLRVGATVTGIPATFLDKESGNIVGIMVDVATEVANHLGAKLEVTETPWSSLIPSLQSGKIDLITAAMYITDKRKEVIDFSNPVYPYCEALLVKSKDQKGYTSIEELKGQVMAGQVGTVYVKGLEESGFSDVKVYDNIGDILMELTNGRVDAALVDGPVARYLVKSNPQFNVSVVNTYEPTMCGDIGIGMAKGNPGLVAEVNKVVEKLHKSGKIQEILSRWGD